MTVLEMPKLGMTMKEGKIVKWLVKEGEEVKKGQGVVEILTDKISSIVESPVDGALLLILVQEGEKAPIQAPLAQLGEVGSLTEEPPKREEGSMSPAAMECAKRARAEIPSIEGSGPGGRILRRDIKNYLKREGIPLPKEEGLGDERISPKAHQLALNEGLALDEIKDLKGSGPKGRVLKRDVREALRSKKKEREERGPLLSPVAKEMVKERGLTAASLKGTGPGGRVMRKDVERSLAKEERIEERIEERRGEAPTPHRLATAESMMESLQKTAQATLTIEAHVDGLFDLYHKIKEEGISLNAIFVKALTRALSSYPSLNATYTDQEIVYLPDIHVGMAVDTERGLLVPVLKDASKKDLLTITAELKDLIQRCREGQITYEELTGGTITISNLGSLGIRAFTPILNYPEVAILGIGSVKEVLMVKEGAFFPGKELILSLTIDHRIIDGAVAGRFLRDYRGLLEDPAPLILA